jgi:hypothetical protein
MEAICETFLHYVDFSSCRSAATMELVPVYFHQRFIALFFVFFLTTAGICAQIYLFFNLQNHPPLSVSFRKSVPWLSLYHNLTLLQLEV